MHQHCPDQSSVHCSRLLVWQEGTEYSCRAAALVSQIMECTFHEDAFKQQNIIHDGHTSPCYTSLERQWELLIVLHDQTIVKSVKMPDVKSPP